MIGPMINQPFFQLTLPLMVTILIATFTATWSTNKRLEKIIRRLDDVSRRLDDVNRRFDRSGICAYVHRSSSHCAGGTQLAAVHG